MRLISRVGIVLCSDYEDVFAAAASHSALHLESRFKTHAETDRSQQGEKPHDETGLRTQKPTRAVSNGIGIDVLGYHTASVSNFQSIKVSTGYRG